MRSARTRSGTSSPPICSTLGYGIPKMAERLGHDPGTLIRYYARVSPARRRQAADQIVGLVAPDEAN